MQNPRRKFNPALLLVALIAAGCGDNGLAPPQATAPQFHTYIPFAPDAPEAELVAICKVGPPDTYSFHAQVTSGVGGVGNPRTAPTTGPNGTGTPILKGDTDLDGNADYQIVVTASDFLTYGGNTVQGACLENAAGTHTDLAWTGGADVGITITETNIPAGKEFVKTDVYNRLGNATTGTTTATYGLGNPVTVLVSGNKGANAIFFNKVSLTPPALEVVKSPASQTVDAGDPISFTMTVANIGQTTANNVTLTDPLPGPLSLTWSTPTAGCSIDPNNLLTCNLGDLAGGASATVVVTSAATTGDMCSAYNNTATVTSANAASATSNTVDATVQCANIDLTKTADNATVSAGDVIGFGMVLKSNGPATAKGVTLSDNLPTGSGISWSIDTQPGQGSCSISSGVLSCNFGDMPASTSVSVHVKSPTTALSCSAYNNTAAAAASNFGSVNASASTTVLCPPSLTVRKTADQSSVTAGSPIGFTINLSSNGPGTALAVTVSDALPTGTGIVWSIDAAHSSAGCTIVSNTLSCSFGDLAAGATRYVHITSPTINGSCGAYPNTASARASNHATVSSGATVNVTGCTQLCTGTMGGWGQGAQGKNIGWLRDTYFKTVYPTTNGLIVGGAKSIKLTTALAVENYLPATKTPGVLTKGYTNPLTTESGVFGGQVTALKLNVDFSNAAVGFWKPGLANAVLTAGPLAGKTVAQVLAIAQSVLGGGALPTGVSSVSELNNIVDAINNSFDGNSGACSYGNGYVRP